MLTRLKTLRSKIPKLKIREDRAILSACVGIALVFWLLVKLSQSYQTERPVRFHFAVPEDKTLAKAPPSDMKVEIEGNGWDLLFDYFANPQLVLEYDLTQTDRLELNRGQIRSDLLRRLYSENIRIIEVNYDRLGFALEQKVSRKVPIRLQASLRFAPEHYLRRPVRLQPDSVLVTGPASQVDEIHEWVSDSLLVYDLRGDQTRIVSLRPPPAVLRLSTAKVEALIEVEQFTEKSIFVPLVVKNAPPSDSLRFFPQRVRVTFAVGLSHYNQITADSFRLIADLKDVALDQSRNRVAIDLEKIPDSVRNVQFSPRSAEFFIVQHTDVSKRQ